MAGHISTVDGAAIKTDIGRLEHREHSRWRVYPQVVTSVVQLKAAATADTFGSWVEIIPINTVPFPSDVIGVIVEVPSAVTTYHIQLGISATTDPPGTNDEAGERRLKIAEVPVKRATEILEIRSQNVPAKYSVWGRLKTASGNADTADISIVLSRHVEVSQPVAKWPAFPW